MYSSCDALTAPVMGSRSYCVPRYQRAGPSSLKRTRFRAPFYFINLGLTPYRHRYCTYLYYYLGRVLLGFLIVHVLDVYAPVGDEFL